jgi:hypothetical protein
MTEQPMTGGVSRQGLDDAFEGEEIYKSNLILEAQLLRAQQRLDEAAAKMALAAEIEERLGTLCEEKGLKDKAWVHLFSAVSCWAQAGNFHSAITLGDELVARPDLPARLRQRVLEYTQSLRLRRSQWSEALVATGIEG